MDNTGYEDIMNCTHINALNRFALKHQRGWKRLLNSCWLKAAYPSGTSDEDCALLQQLRNNGGPAILPQFTPRPDGYKQVAYLTKDRMERFTVKRGWYVTAWRIVSRDGIDLIQPWSETKSEASETATAEGIFLLGQL